jgi:hypothetical protein
MKDKDNYRRKFPFTKEHSIYAKESLKLSSASKHSLEEVQSKQTTKKQMYFSMSKWP